MVLNNNIYIYIYIETITFNNNNHYITSTMDALSDMITPLLGGGMINSLA